MTPRRAGTGRVYLGIDPGRRRVGVAVADDETRFARPLEVVDVSTIDPILRIAQLATELGAAAVVVGRPTGLSGASGPAVREQQGFVRALREAVGVPVREFDERLTTVVADQGLEAAGARQQNRRRMRDAVAAQVMLQGFIDSEAP